MRLHILRLVLNLKRIQDAEQVLGANILTETAVHLHSDRLELKLNINICTCSALHWADKHYLSKGSFPLYFTRWKNTAELLPEAFQGKITLVMLHLRHGWFWEAPLEVIWSNPFPRAGSARADCPGSHRQIWRLHHSKPVPGFGPLTVKIGISCTSRGTLLCHQQVCLLPLVLSQGTTEKTLAVSLSMSSIQIPTDKISLNLFQAEQSHLSQPFLRWKMVRPPSSSILWPFAGLSLTIPCLCPKSSIVLH